jgi:hypothetical protein
MQFLLEYAGRQTWKLSRVRKIPIFHVSPFILRLCFISVLAPVALLDMA